MSLLGSGSSEHPKLLLIGQGILEAWLPHRTAVAEVASEVVFGAALISRKPKLRVCGLTWRDDWSLINGIHQVIVF